jgi:hypothetical protein
MKGERNGKLKVNMILQKEISEQPPMDSTSVDNFNCMGRRKKGIGAVILKHKILTSRVKAPLA